MRRRNFACALAAAALLGMAGLASAQPYPNKPVRVIIPFPPGGTLDFVGRMLAQKLSEQTGQQFVIENRPGGNNMIGSAAVAAAPADGYTLLFNASTFTTTPMTVKASQYDVLKDFTPIALVAKAPLSVSIAAQLPATDIRTLTAHARANPGKLTFAIGSTGSAGNLATELLRRAGNLDILIVPYKGSGPAYQDLLGGRIDGFVDPILGAVGHHKGGKLKIIAVTSKTRVPTLPDVPTVGETIPGYEFYSWYGLWGPAKLPADIAKKLNAETNKALADLREKLEGQGLFVTPGSIEDFVKFQAEDMALSRKIITEGNIRAD
jgi:tripartite-type tricarboxylate transporter receptor subunit TctC